MNNKTKPGWSAARVLAQYPPPVNLFLHCQKNVYLPGRPQQFSIWSHGAEYGFDAHVNWSDQEPIQDDLYRRWGMAGGVEDSSDGRIVQCCGDVSMVKAEMNGWLAANFKTPVNFWVVSIQEVFEFSCVIGLNRLPMYDIMTAYRFCGIDFAPYFKKANGAVISKTGGSAVRSGAYLAGELHARISNHYQNKKINDQDEDET